MESAFLRLNFKDVGKSLVVVVLVAVLQFILSALQGSGLEAFSAPNLLQALDLALKAGAGYLLKNLLSKENKFLGVVG